MALFKVSIEDSKRFQVELSTALGKPYEVEMNKEVLGFLGVVKEIFDFVIFYNGDAIAGVEYKSKLPNPSWEIHHDYYIDKFRKVGLKYGVLYYGDDNKVYLWRTGQYNFQIMTFDGIVTAIAGDQACGDRLSSEEITQKIKELIPIKWLKAQICENLKNTIDTLFTDENIIHCEDDATISLKPEAEDLLFKELLPKDEKKDEYLHVCRYTTLNSLFLTLKDKTHAMCSITCMNDKGEIFYADKYVGQGAYAATSYAIQQNNDCFILSCCNERMKDNLTMWRLYGDNGMGVCLEYEVDNSLIDNERFFFAPVSYGDEAIHPELEFIKAVRLWRDNGWRFDLKRWHIWKHFFKSYLFREEKEVRLVYIKPKTSKEKVEWIMDSSNNIVSRICKFSIEKGQLPLNLTGALIGPKCSEQGSNVDQFNYMNSQQKVIPIKGWKPSIRPSDIEDYR